MHPWLWPWSCCASQDFPGVSWCPEPQQEQRSNVVHGVGGCSAKGMWDGCEPPACARAPFTHLSPPGSNHPPIPALGHLSPSLLIIPPLSWQVSQCPLSPCRVVGVMPQDPFLGATQICGAGGLPALRVGAVTSWQVWHLHGRHGSACRWHCHLGSTAAPLLSHLHGCCCLGNCGQMLAGIQRGEGW